MKHHWTAPPGSVILSKKPDHKKLPDGTWQITFHFTYRSDQGLGFDWFESDAIGDACCREIDHIAERYRQ